MLLEQCTASASQQIPIEMKEIKRMVGVTTSTSPTLYAVLILLTSVTGVWVIICDAAILNRLAGVYSAFI